MILLQNLAGPLGWAVLGISLLVIFGLIVMLISWYKKVPQGKAIIRTGVGGTKVAIENGIIVVPGIQMYEVMDLSVRTIEISRMKEDGLICKDNIRADTKVVFFVRINKEVADIKKVAQSIGCQRASDTATLRELFEAKFSEAIKTVGKRFDFVELYDSREKFNSEIQNAIGLNLNGYILEDASIDYLEQTDISYLKENNILDAEGIKKITELTAQQKVKANFIRREEEKTITEQNAEAKEAILEYERQLIEKEERQKREIANIKAREAAEIAKINEEERLRSEMVRIKTEEELQVAEENRMRQVIVALKNKERTEAIEQERVEKDRMLERTEREKIVTLAEIEKQRAVEEEKKNIQDVIRDRIMVEKKVVEQEEVIKDTKVLAEAERLRKKEVIQAQAKGEATVIEQQKLAEAAKLAAEINAEKLLIDAEAEKNAAEKEAEARKIQAEATAAEEATIGLSEAQVIEAKAKAKELEGKLEASVLERKAQAEAIGIEAKAEALRKQGRAEAEVADEKGQAEARVLELKFAAEAKGIEQKANAMKELDGVGREHEEFKLRLETEKEIQLANINVSKDIANAQAGVLGEAMKHANIDIVGGEMQFVNSILNSVQRGKSIDGLLNHSSHLNSLSQNLLSSASGNGEGLLPQLGNLIRRAGLTMDDIKDLTLTALLLRLGEQSGTVEEKSLLKRLTAKVEELGLGALSAGQLL
ncbi:flotillin family protein [Phaeodactylibacter sp.]|uniref:flotillin family protein n=1 Tax=Phaeodactylibacter sp. TaxID=1940289 RepID=UPI0025DB4A67|nr:flotillin family protein [Phaeodactylibacter sp.]MCI4647520.1 flotillin family protein [Phaeodactylibacter sp.]MCI5093587.1 flotillin family protein [Phaeodactylibacter sp.]